MKNIVISLSTLAILLSTTVSGVKAQASLTAQAFAEIIAALSATETTQLNFGKFSPNNQGGKIILTPDGTRTTEGTIILGGGSHNAGSFYITGEYDATFSITLPAGSSYLTNTLNAKTMEINQWTSFPAPGIGVGKLTGGAMTVRIGAVLNVGDMNANPVGIYTGTYAITFAYN